MKFFCFTFIFLLFELASSFVPRRWTHLRAYTDGEQGRFIKMATPSPAKSDSSPMSGFFTNSSPETKRVVPIVMDGKTKFKIVYVVLESQYQSALTKACHSINEGKEGVAVEAVGYLLEELRNPAVFEQFKEDVANANIFIGSLIFIQELADKVNVHPHFYPFITFLLGCGSSYSKQGPFRRCFNFSLDA